jgi:aminoglycoside 6'-N-acetyltransferase I
VEIATATLQDAAAWFALRRALWPEASDAEHHADIARIASDPARYGAFLARDGVAAVGFAEASLRHDYVNGCETSPVGFLEGIYITPARRQEGVARALTLAVEQWTRARGCTELASDALLENIDSHRMHVALGFAETERVVGFRKVLGPRKVG